MDSSKRLEALSQQMGARKNRTDFSFADEGRIGIIYMNSPKDLNSLCTEMQQELAEKFLLLDKNPQVKVIVLLSKLEKVFCAGANIKEFIDLTYEQLLNNDTFYYFERVISDIKKPIIVGVNGVAFGGGLETTLMGDMAVLREDTKIGLPEINLGLIPGWGGTQRLTKIVGKFNASRHILSGEPITAQRALEMGLAVQVFPKDNFHESVINFAKKFSCKSNAALITGKKAIKAAEELGVSEGIKFERSIFHPLFTTKGKVEGTTAFIQKRKANFNDM